VTQEILSAVNLGLDIVLKSVTIVLLAYGIYLLRRLDEVVQETEESVESVEEAADEAASLMSLSNKIPLLGGSG
jgi:predicted nucleic acid-binding protein